MSELNDEKQLVFKDDWCQIFYNHRQEKIYVEDTREDNVGVILTMEEWYRTTAAVLRIRNGISEQKPNER